jgi:peptidyl-dipeptidase Dcp
LKIANRFERAQLLLYHSRTLCIRRAHGRKSGKVLSSLTIYWLAKPAAQKEFADYRLSPKKLTIEQLGKHVVIILEKLKTKKLFDFDDEKLKPYFQLEKY